MPALADSGQRIGPLRSGQSTEVACVLVFAKGRRVRILIAEDNVELARQIKAALEQARYVAEVTKDGKETYFLGDTESWDVIILNLGLPGFDGIDLLKRWRSSGNQVPVLVLTSRDIWREKVASLRAGADDYLMRHKGEVIPNTELTEHIYEQDFDLDSNVIEVLVSCLRNKLCPDLIETRRGPGYQIEAFERPARVAPFQRRLS
jgi:DNA-binding response OmpR family regulator